MDTHDFFWDLAEELMSDRDVEEGTLMGHACLRVGGEFAAMPELETGGLVVKLPADRVAGLIDDGTGASFAPAGKVFREWLYVEDQDERTWRSLLDEALAYARS